VIGDPSLSVGNVAADRARRRSAVRAPRARAADVIRQPGASDVDIGVKAASLSRLSMREQVAIAIDDTL
jgi:hypothetical protein